MNAVNTNQCAFMYRFQLFECFILSVRLCCQGTKFVCSSYTVEVYANVPEQFLSLCVFLSKLCSIRRIRIG